MLIALLILTMAIPNGPIPDDLDLLTAVLGRPIVWAYGRHVVGGNVIVIDDSPTDHRRVFVALGEGEWDAPENVFVNGETFTDRTGLADGQGFLFHPGKPGEAGTGGETGSQKISRWFPAGVTQLNFSHTAYIALWIPRDVAAPGPDLDIRGVYRARKLQEYDSGGAPTVYQWSANPAWEILDLLLKFYKFPTSRIDFASFVTAAADCDVLVGGNKRFESHLFFTEEQGDQALDRLLATCRGFLTDYAGKVSLRVDKARASVHDFSMDNITAGSFHWENADTSRRPNRIVVKFRDVDNSYQHVEKIVDDETHQDKTKRITRAELDLGNSRYGQAFRIGKYLLSRATALPELVRLRGLQDSFHLMPGDVVRVKHDAAPWTYSGVDPEFKEFEVIECTDLPNEERDLLFQEYSAAIYTDDEETSQALASPAVQAREGLAGLVTGVSVSEGPAISRDGHVVSRVTCSFTPPSPKKNWAGVRIFITGYQGGTNPLEVATFTDSPGRFDLEPTNETITVFFVSFSADGRLRAVLTAPSATVLLDGQASAPVTPSGFTCQAVASKGQVVILTWSENIEADISHYEVARRQDATAPGDADVVATVAAAGELATKKAQWEDAPGSATAQYRYYVRAVNTTSLKSAFTTTCAIRALAPDGTKDISTPTQGTSPTGLYTINWGVETGSEATPGALVVKFDASGVPAESFNMEGVYIHRFEVDSWADNDCTTDFQTRVFEFAFNPARSERMVLFWPNRYLKQVRAFMVNYFGLSPSAALITWTCGSLAFSGSEAQDAKPPTANFDKAVQDYGARKVIGRSTGDLELDTNSASAKIRAIKTLTADVGYQVGGAGPSGQYLRGDGTKAVFNTIQPNDLPDASASQRGAVNTAGQTLAGEKTFQDGVNASGSSAGLRGRRFIQDTRPTLKDDEIAMWRRENPSPAKDGILYFDGTNFFWLRGEAGGTVTLEVNP